MLFLAVFADENGLFIAVRWYYGNITRKDAERLLLTAQNEDYSFLVRLCSKPEIPYSLSGKAI